ncbi:MAG: hypothetical protein QGF91_02825 [Gammaproteobacteria bacterium]|jgi:hypothetical protein|nr:hypothetical protein [Gammaproteobacteria bacterium]
MASDARSNQKVSYKLLDRFTDLLICSRCFRRHVRQPVRQLLSTRHRPLALCNECSCKASAEHEARVTRLDQASHS